MTCPSQVYQSQAPALPKPKPRRGRGAHEAMTCLLFLARDGATMDVGSFSAGTSMAQVGRLGALAEEQNQLCFPLKDTSAHQ